ncbi:histidine triad nucleotide-binding protein [Candidatus Dependentiae bacterium]|nr:MAG: histidine triad nucleotide-binding protein [Candidatus Dependentiae bacterium]
MDSCIFCSIIDKKIETTIISDNEQVIAINDISPKAPTHILIIPKKHIINMADISEENMDTIAKMALMAKELSKQHSQFNLVCNNGPEAGQTVMHLHWHFLAGTDFFKKIF